MKLVTFTKKDGGERIGALIGGESQVVDLREAGEITGAADNPAFATMLAFIEASEPALETARRLLGNPPDQAVLESGDIPLRTPGCSQEKG